MQTTVIETTSTHDAVAVVTYTDGEPLIEITNTGKRATAVLSRAGATALRDALVEELGEAPKAAEPAKLKVGDMVRIVDHGFGHGQVRHYLPVGSTARIVEVLDKTNGRRSDYLVDGCDEDGTSLNQRVAASSIEPVTPATPTAAIPERLVEALRELYAVMPRGTRMDPDMGRDPEAPRYLLAMRDVFLAARAAGLLEPTKPDLSGYMAPCPEGYGTVLGHLVQQGRFPEDMGLYEGRRLAAIAKERDTPRLWVDVSPALAEICDRVRAYPAEFLAEHLGPIA